MKTVLAGALLQVVPSAAAETCGIYEAGGGYQAKYSGGAFYLTINPVDWAEDPKHKPPSCCPCTNYAYQVDAGREWYCQDRAGKCSSASDCTGEGYLCDNKPTLGKSENDFPLLEEKLTVEGVCPGVDTIATMEETEKKYFVEKMKTACKARADAEEKYLDVIGGMGSNSKPPYCSQRGKYFYWNPNGASVKACDAAGYACICAEVDVVKALVVKNYPEVPASAHATKNDSEETSQSLEDAEDAVLVSRWGEQEEGAAMAASKVTPAAMNSNMMFLPGGGIKNPPQMQAPHCDTQKVKCPKNFERIFPAPHFFRAEEATVETCCEKSCPKDHPCENHECPSFSTMGKYPCNLWPEVTDSTNLDSTCCRPIIVGGPAKPPVPEVEYICDHFDCSKPGFSAIEGKRVPSLQHRNEEECCEHKCETHDCPQWATKKLREFWTNSPIMEEACCHTIYTGGPALPPKSCHNFKCGKGWVKKDPSEFVPFPVNQETCCDEVATCNPKFCAEWQCLGKVGWCSCYDDEKNYDCDEEGEPCDCPPRTCATSWTCPDGWHDKTDLGNMMMDIPCPNNLCSDDVCCAAPTASPTLAPTGNPTTSPTAAPTDFAFSGISHITDCGNMLYWNIRAGQHNKGPLRGKYCQASGATSGPNAIADCRCMDNQSQKYKFIQSRPVSRVCSMSTQHQGNGPCSSKRMCEPINGKMVCKEAVGDVYVNPSYGGQVVPPMTRNGNSLDVQYITQCTTNLGKVFGKLWTEVQKNLKLPTSRKDDWAKNGNDRNWEYRLTKTNTFTCHNGVYEFDTWDGGELFLSAEIYGRPPRGKSGMQNNDPVWYWTKRRCCGGW